jgi:anti-sigma28 factor (negative regulator of flagellin synthesis)
MKFVSATDVAIANALGNKTLALVERVSRLGGTFIAIEDEYNVIEVQDTLQAANDRVEAIKQAIA